SLDTGEEVALENTTKILFDLLLMFAAAKIIGELFERVKQPAVIGEILAGIVLGPFIFGLINPLHAETFHVYEVFAEVGVIILLFSIGLHIKVDDILKVGKTSSVVAILGVILPFFFGYLYTLTSDHTTVEAMFIGAAMVATSVGITARVFADLGILDSRVAKVMLAAAVIDDILALLVLAVVTGLGQGTISYVKITLLTLEAAGFIIFLTIIGKGLIPRLGPFLGFFKTKNAPFALALLFCLGLSAVASYIDLAAIVGAFMAGMVLAELNVEFRFSSKFESLYDFFVPFFFVVMGTQVDLSVFTRFNLVGAALILTLFAILGKLIGCGLGALSLGWKEASVVGVGMVPRGEVGMIVASIGLGMGVISTDLYSIVIFMVIATTILTPPVLAVMISRKFVKPKEEERVEKRIDELPVDL
ncbi:MAG: cation:proton antiporter, partial [Candidatus Zixiibacteriota bacterium]